MTFEMIKETYKDLDLITSQIKQLQRRLFVIKKCNYYNSNELIYIEVKHFFVIKFF